MHVPSPLATPLGFLPLPAVERTIGLLFGRVLRAHPGLFDRLGEHKAKRFAFSPVDLPLIFLVEPARPAISVHRKPAQVEADASVEAPLFVLLALLEGRCDADTLFFSRDLSVSGDMEAILAMRNALDDSDIDLPRDLSQMAGPFAPLVQRIAGDIRSRVLGAA